LDCCWHLRSPQHAEAHRSHWYACSGVLSKLERRVRSTSPLCLLIQRRVIVLRAGVRGSLPGSTRVLLSLQDIERPVHGTHTATYRAMPALADTCDRGPLARIRFAGFHVADAESRANRPLGACAPPAGAVNQPVGSTQRPHRSHRGCWSCNGLATWAWNRARAVCRHRFKKGVNNNDCAVNSDPVTLNNSCMHYI
jgi:hypothetical protein